MRLLFSKHLTLLLGCFYRRSIYLSFMDLTLLCVPVLVFCLSVLCCTVCVCHIEFVTFGILTICRLWLGNVVRIYLCQVSRKCNGFLKLANSVHVTVIEVLSKHTRNAFWQCTYWFWYLVSKLADQVFLHCELKNPLRSNIGPCPTKIGSLSLFYANDADFKSKMPAKSCDLL